jgi:hypothetical protein
VPRLDASVVSGLAHDEAVAKMLLPNRSCVEKLQQKLAGDMEGGRDQLPSLQEAVSTCSIHSV